MAIIPSNYRSFADPVRSCVLKLPNGRDSGTPLAVGEVEVAQVIATDAKLAHIRIDSPSMNSRDQEQELLEVFNEAADEITNEDLAERESLLVGFSDRRPRSG